MHSELEKCIPVVQQKLRDMFGTQINITIEAGQELSKQALFEKMQEHFAPMQARRDELAQNPDYVWDILRDGAARARVEAEKTMEKVRYAVGLR
jgi:hypothetical protein